MRFSQRTIIALAGAMPIVIAPGSAIAQSSGNSPHLLMRINVKQLPAKLDNDPRPAGQIAKWLSP